MTAEVSRQAPGSGRKIVLLWVGWTLALALVAWGISSADFAIALVTANGRPISGSEFAATLLALAYLPPLVITVVWLVVRRLRRRR